MHGRVELVDVKTALQQEKLNAGRDLVGLTALGDQGGGDRAHANRDDRRDVQRLCGLGIADDGTGHDPADIDDLAVRTDMMLVQRLAGDMKLAAELTGIALAGASAGIVDDSGNHRASLR